MPHFARLLHAQEGAYRAAQAVYRKGLGSVRMYEISAYAGIQNESNKFKGLQADRFW